MKIKMAAEKRKFVVPSVEELDEKHAASSTSGSSLKVFKTSSSSFKSLKNNSDSETRKRLLNALSSHPCSSADKEAKSDPITDSESSKSDLSATSTAVDSRGTSTSSNTEPVIAGKSFKDTFAFLKNTRHYEEADAKGWSTKSGPWTGPWTSPRRRSMDPRSTFCTDPDAKMKEIESSRPAQPKVIIPSKPKPNAIQVNPRQKGNPVLKSIRCVPWEYSDIVPDYVMGATTCALFLSLRYHHFNPEYIHERLKQLGKSYELRILLVLVDVKDPHQTLRELAKMAILADLTMILSWSSEEAGKYLETYKVYENKPVDVLQGQSDGDYLSRLQDCLTTVKGINKTDVLTLNSAFGTLANIAKASKDDLIFLPGFGPLKAKRLQSILHEPFLAKNKKSTDKETDEL